MKIKTQIRLSNDRLYVLQTNICTRIIICKATASIGVLYVHAELMSIMSSSLERDYAGHAKNLPLDASTTNEASSYVCREMQNQ